MLRVLEHGIRIAGVVVDYNTLGVDRPSDVPLVEAVLRDNAVQRALFERTQSMGRGS
jgi:CMP-2-keto-3-deoxyoctulosonic acid synthetase